MILEDQIITLREENLKLKDRIAFNESSRGLSLGSLTPTIKNRNPIKIINNFEVLVTLDDQTQPFKLPSKVSS